MNKILYIFFLLFSAYLTSGQIIKGTVLEKTVAEDLALTGAIVQWSSGPTNAVFTDENGAFEVFKEAHHYQLVISYLGYKTDSVLVQGEGPLTVYLEADNTLLDEVKVKSSSTAFDNIAPIQTQIITSKELAKAACCNLSESFETNASVSVSLSDAVTGSKQLQMLGLSGKYIQTNVENMPSIRGLSIPFGLNHVPGTWIQSIDVAKGVASVVNGYESMIGAINVELQKPDLGPKVYLNFYTNELGRGEVNFNVNKKLSNRWSTGLLTHGSFLKTSIDRNQDGFKDLPGYHQINLLNRWKYSGDRLMSQFGVNYLQENRDGGQLEQISSPYLFTNDTEKLTLFAKTAILFPQTPYRGLGLILNASLLDSKSLIGNNTYNAEENSFSANLIYQDILGNTNHTYKTGLSFLADNYDEAFDNFTSPLILKREELVPGAFLEYAYNRLDKTILVLGLRLDEHNLFGTQITPRAHFKKNIGENSIWRLSIGRGFRVPTPLSEYYGNLVSNRQVIPFEVVEPEISWNYGTSLMKNFGKNVLTLDVYHTEFAQQVIMDMESLGIHRIYGSRDRSFSTSAQAELLLVPSDRWEIKMAYRWQNVKQTFDQEGQKTLQEKQFVPKSIALLNISYAEPYDKWKVDATVQYKGKQRLPGFDGNEYSPAFLTLNSQISRNFVDWEYYIGAENFLNYKQPSPIISAGNPNDETFDAGQIWGPIVGRTIYLGARYRLR
ncbi:MAG: outer membrane receptor for ferrienterochelin and colicins [Arcticibacterium sp.]|jgi:outer membrane receptor for ferrienterochelin and colicins